MRYIHGIVVMVPWCDADNKRNHSRFSFNGDVDRRRVRRMLRRALNSIGLKPRKWWLDHYIKHRSYGYGEPVA
jgi:hypothetical protein